MKYIRIENTNLTAADRQGISKTLNRLPKTTDPQQMAGRQLLKELCTVKEHPEVTLTAKQFIAMLFNPDCVIER